VAGEKVVCYQTDHCGLKIRSIEVALGLSPSNTMRPPSPSIPERDFLFKALEQSLRLDGRALLEARSPALTFGPELGWVECALGKTR